MRKSLTLLAFLLLAAYPFVIYIGLRHFSVRYLALFVAFIVLLRWYLADLFARKNIWLLGATVIGLSLCAFGIFSDNLLMMKCYPVMMNLFFFALFFRSLFQPMTIVETLARLMDPTFPQTAVRYTRKVTQVWCGFFLFNATVAAITAFFLSTAMWTVYNGLIAYLLIGTLFVLEYAVRIQIKKRL